MWTSGVFLFAVAIVLACGRQSAARASYCGRELADALELVCNSTYYTPVGEERSPAGESVRKRSPLLSLLTRQRRSGDAWNYDGVVEQCCRRTCSLEEMRAYCG